jgi:hypothetical protein
MMRKSLIVCTLLVALCACGEEEKPVAKPANKTIDPRLIYGQWRNVSMKLHMNTYRGSDSAFTLDVNETNWEQVMNIRPIRTYFWSDNTYNSMHLDLNDSLFYNPAGRWYLKFDSIFMVDTFPKKGPVYKYKLKTNGTIAEFTGVEDLDGDGKADDEYFGTQRRFEVRQ